MLNFLNILCFLQSILKIILFIMKLKLYLFICLSFKIKNIYKKLIIKLFNIILIQSPLTILVILFIYLI